MNLPIIGRTKYHQGGKGLWLCLTKQHVEKAINDGAQYFQSYIDIADEYRLHVAFGSVIYAVRKVENATEAGWINQRKEKIMDYAQKNNVDIDNTTLDYVLQRLAKEAELPDRIVRSNRRGWKFSHVRLNNLSNPLKNAAIKAVEVAGLDFGAVDCALSLDNKPYIIEINSGPGLQGTSFQKYVDTFTAKIHEIEHGNAPAAHAVHQAAHVAGVGAQNAGADEIPAPQINGAAMVNMMNAVGTEAEAKALLQVLVQQGANNQ
jgi:hypothetical protein